MGMESDRLDEEHLGRSSSANGWIVDYELTFTMPASLTAAVNVDTLTHAIEACVSKRASALTDPIALSCAHLVSKYLRRIS
jgi:alcohol dehydrogenase class IV